MFKHAKYSKPATQHKPMAKGSGVEYRYNNHPKAINPKIRWAPAGQWELIKRKGKKNAIRSR